MRLFVVLTLLVSMGILSAPQGNENNNPAKIVVYSREGGGPVGGTFQERGFFGDIGDTVSGWFGGGNKKPENYPHFHPTEDYDYPIVGEETRSDDEGRKDYDTHGFSTVIYGQPNNPNKGDDSTNISMEDEHGSDINSYSNEKDSGEFDDEERPPNREIIYGIKGRGPNDGGDRRRRRPGGSHSRVYRIWYY